MGCDSRSMADYPSLVRLQTNQTVFPESVHCADHSVIEKPAQIREQTLETDRSTTAFGLQRSASIVNTARLCVNPRRIRII